jgi:hypothetical protein
MAHMKRLSALLGVLLLVGCWMYGETDLRDRMGSAIYEEAGLAKLTGEERSVLAAWIARELGEERKKVARQVADLPEGDDAFGLESVTSRVAALFKAKGPKRIRSRIEGSFTGWDGDTVFRLANGQVWKQMDSDRFYIQAENPEVDIKRAAFGSYLLSVEGYGSSVRVRRVE